MVTRGCIGRRVLVANYGQGILAYYGRVDASAEDICGVTLDVAEVSWFLRLLECSTFGVCS